MSLKFFHVLFIAVSTVMALGVGIWAIEAWRADGAAGWLTLAAVSFAGGAALVVYGGRFLRKARALGIAGLLVAGTLLLPNDALACPACVGTTSSTLQSGMNLGIFVLLGIVAFMFVCFAWFFVSLARRSRHAARPRATFQVPAQEGSI